MAIGGNQVFNREANALFFAGVLADNTAFALRGHGFTPTECFGSMVFILMGRGILGDNNPERHEPPLTRLLFNGILAGSYLLGVGGSKLIHSLMPPSFGNLFATTFTYAAAGFWHKQNQAEPAPVGQR